MPQETANSAEQTIVHAIAVNLTKAQKTNACHAKCITKLKAAYVLDKEKFLESFIKRIYPILQWGKRDTACERLVQFIVQLATTALDDSDATNFDFGLALIDNLVVYANAKDKSIRFRVAQICSLVINALPDEIDIEYVENPIIILFSESIWNNIRDKCTERLMDKNSAVRMFTIGLLNRFQENTIDNEIVNRIVHLMAHDAVKEVRKEAVKQVIMTATTIAHVLDRTRDVEEDVRLTAFKKIAEFVPFKRLTILQRTTVLRTGLQDRSPVVRECCLKELLLGKWLSQVAKVQNQTLFGPCILALLSGLDVESNTDTCEVVLDQIFEHYHEECKGLWSRREALGGMPNAVVDDFATEPATTQANTGRWINFTKVTPEQALYVRCLCQYLHKKSLDTIIHDELLVNEFDAMITGTDFCIILIEHHREAQEYVMTQLLQVCIYLDYSDEKGRTTIVALLSEMLSLFNAPDMYAKEILVALKHILPNREDLMSTVVAHLNKLHKAATTLEEQESITKAPENAKHKKEEEMRKKIDLLEQQRRKFELEKQKAKEADDYDEAKRYKAKEEEVVKQIAAMKHNLEKAKRTTQEDEPSSADFWLRLLIILSEYLEYMSDDLIIHIQNWIKSTVIPCIMDSNRDDLVIQTAYKLLGQYSCFKLEWAQANWTYLETANKESTVVRCSRLTSLFDAWLVHGSKNLNIDEAATVASLSNYLWEALDKKTEASSVEAALVAEGFAKLVFNQKLNAHGLVVLELLLALYHPKSSQSLRLRQCLNVFFPAYIASTGLVPAPSQVISEQVIPLCQRVKQLMNSVDDGCDIDAQKLFEYVFFLTAPVGQIACVHDRMVLDMLMDAGLCFKRSDNESLATMMVKIAVMHAHLSKDHDQATLRRIRHMMEQDVLPKLKNKILTKTCVNFVSRVKLLQGEESDGMVLEDDTELEKMKETLADAVPLEDNRETKKVPPTPAKKKKSAAKKVTEKENVKPAANTSKKLTKKKPASSKKRVQKDDSEEEMLLAISSSEDDDEIAKPKIAPTPTTHKVRGALLDKAIMDALDMMSEDDD